MAAELNILKLTNAPEARPAKQASSAPSRDGSEGEGFSSVLQRVNGEAQERPQAKPAEDESNRNPENGLAAGKEENLAGEEGSSRSASLSPNEPDQVEKPEALETDPLQTSEQAQVLVSNAGGELPFLAPLPELFAQATQEIPVEQGVDLSALVSGEVLEAAAETALPLAPEKLNAPVEVEVPVAELPKSALDEALALLEPVSEEALPELSFELPKPVQEAKKEAAPVVHAAPEAVVAQAPVVESSDAETDSEGEKNQEQHRSFLPKSSERPEDSGEGKKEDSGSMERAASRVASHAAALPQEESKSSFDLFRELEASVERSVRKLDANLSASETGAAESASKEASASDFNQFLREFQGSEKLHESKAPAAVASAESRRPLPGSLEDQVFRQIRMKLEPGLSRVDIKLLPPELGSVRIQFEMEGDRMTARVEAKESATAALLERHLPELKSTLAQAGFDVKEFEITTGSAFLGLGLQNGNANEAENEAREGSGRFSDRRNSEVEGSDAESGELVVSRAGGGIDYVI